MREIKFRAWDKACNCYAKNWKLYLNGSVSISDTWATSDVILEQYTGLKDKNGKDIYEGDVLLYVETNTGIVKIDTSGACAVGFECFINSINFQNCKVIGNIHEN